MIFSLTFSIQDITMFLTFRFCRDWEFRAMKTQAQDAKTPSHSGFNPPHLLYNRAHILGRQPPDLPGVHPHICYIKGGMDPGLNPRFGVLRCGLRRGLTKVKILNHKRYLFNSGSS
jgi:hypothetical protein